MAEQMRVGVGDKGRTNLDDLKNYKMMQRRSNTSKKHEEKKLDIKVLH